MATQLETQVVGDGEEESAAVPFWGKLLAGNKFARSETLVKDDYYIGRRSTNDIFIDDPAISNVHCKITRTHAPNSVDKAREDMNVFIIDSSANGTYVNSEKLKKSVGRVLKHGDEIRLTSKANAPVFVYHDANSMDETSEVKQKYNFTKKLGSGACGEVWLGVNKTTGSQFAIKVIQKKKFSLIGSMPQPNLKAEVEILERLDHPNVINVVEMFDTPEAMYIVLELAKGGELFDRIVEKDKLSEQEAKLVFTQLLHAVKYLHDNGVAHRDLKPENILLDRKETRSLVKVTDFGLAKLVDPKSFMKTMCGTPTYQAPEVILSSAQGYNPAVDLWSLGVILYIMLAGFPPFSDDIGWNDRMYSVNEQITGGIYSFPDPYWRGVSPDAIDLIKRLLTVEPDQRIKIDEALQHPFIKDEAVAAEIQTLMDEHAANAVKEKLSDLSHTKVVINRKHERDAEDDGEPSAKAAKE